MFDLATRDIKYLSGVRRSVLRCSMGIGHFSCTICYITFHINMGRSRIYYIQEIDGTMPYIQLKGEILSLRRLEKAPAQADSSFSGRYGVVDLVWFQGIKYLVGKYKVHQEYIVFGNRPSSMVE